MGDVMHKLTGLIAFAAAILASAPSLGQLVQEVVVTGSRISGDDYSRIPAVVVQRRADFLVQRVRLTNDTRAEDARRKELYQTIREYLLCSAAIAPISSNLPPST
jgi:hypothetical protein